MYCFKYVLKVFNVGTSLITLGISFKSLEPLYTNEFLKHSLLGLGTYKQAL